MIVRGVYKRRRGQSGLTLIELLVAMAVTTIIFGGLGGALIILMRTPPETVANLTSSASAFQTGSMFADDIQSAGPETGELAVTRGTPGCGGGPSLVRAVSREGGDVQVRSYSVSTNKDTLERRVCTGSDQADALAQNPSVGTVVRDLDPGVEPEVNCRASAVANTAPTTPDGDYQCRLVSMTVTTAANLKFTVEGRRNTVQTPLESGAPPKQQCTLNASADTYISTQPRKRDDPKYYGTDVEFVVQGSGKKTGFMRIDLLSPCRGEDEPRLLPGGKSITSAELSLNLTDSHDKPSTPSSFRLTTVPPAFRWSEYTLDENGVDGCTQMSAMPDMKPDDPPLPLATNLPCGSNSNADWFGTFSIGPGGLSGLGNNPVNVKVSVLGTVQRWYTGTMPNNGWALDRDVDEGGDRRVGGWRFGSKERNSLGPQLVVKWGD
ncbi:prepilin-type N-terminal cleavage/methylation domain-containing protein [Candidatus Microthrix parvicella]|uniref:prepilin-type N-terminal cleavage/methylation domain-containing protein n=1 Tax=Candidatus Neomicrothrix parvicella TaxID=41950 RepID=UPI0003667771|nr:prepilin-type N-terminal cleavage/methylation domain-containing protein [Candidatus Microthrix parvicella]